MRLKEVIYPVPKGDGPPCPNCGEDLFRGLIPCPDNRLGCGVLHHGFTCDACGKIYQSANERIELSSKPDS